MVLENTTLSKPKVLLVDDDERNLLAFEASLAGINCEIVTARSGEEAILLIEDQEFAAVLLDIQMPSLNGFETAKKIRTLPNGKILPVLFITARALERDVINNAYERGAADVLSKPIDPIILQSKINVFIELFEARQQKRLLAETRYFLSGESEMAQAFRSKDWATTPLGPIVHWPQSLRTAIGIMLKSKFPMFISWGKDRTFLYNDAYAPILGEKHPKALGRRFYDNWFEIWDSISPLIDTVDRGESVYLEDLKLIMHRHKQGKLEETYFTFSYSPIRDESDEVKGLFCACVETTARKKGEDALRKSEESLKLALTSANMGTWKINLKTNEIVASPELAKILGVEGYRDDVFSSMEKFVHPDDRERTAETFRKSLEENSLYESEYRIIRPDGEIRWILSRGQAPYDNGQAFSISGITVDITDRKQKEDFDKELVSVLETMTDGFFSIGRNHRFTYVNYEMQRFAGMVREQMIGKTVDELFPAPDLKKFMSHYIQVMETGAPVRFEDVYDGRILQVQAYQSKDGGAAVFFRDITEQRKTQQEILESQQKLDQIFNESPSTLSLMVGPEHVYEKANKKFFEFSGNDTSIIGKPLKEVYKGENQDFFISTLNRVYETGVPFTGKEFPITIKKDGHEADHYIDFIYQPLRDSQGKVYGIVSQTFDVTEKVMAQRDLKAAKEEAERANNLKSAFLANMSHEIRTPLGAMIGFTDLLRDSNVTEAEKNDYLDILARNGDQLSVIINDILDLSKVEAGHLNLEFTEAHPDQIALDVISLLKMKAKEKGLNLEYSSHETTPATIISDPLRIRQVLMNLITNAIKFTPQGSIKLRSYACRTEKNEEAICFEIQDTGIGIPENMKDNVFEMFVQADGSMTRRFGGTGLGLALSRKLAQVLGGDVTIIETDQEQGTTFQFLVAHRPQMRDLKSEPLIHHRPPDISQNALEGIKVLVVDDAPDNQHLIKKYLTKHGALVESANNGLVGYQKALEENFDLVLMDIQMPEMDGYTATQKLRGEGFTKPIIALTAHAMSEVRKKCMSVGCNDHLSKPINSKELLAAIARNVYPIEK